ncbi:MAG: hypothetical protein AAF202_09170 [Pseudomonadota bacterium]
MPVLLAGQAGGALTTGRLIDYGPNYDDGAFLRAPDTYGRNGYREGRVYNQLLVTLLQAMGLSPSQYESSPGSGVWCIWKRLRLVYRWRVQRWSHRQESLAAWSAWRVDLIKKGRWVAGHKVGLCL